MENDEELLDLLVNEPIALDIDKLEDKTMTKGDRIADLYQKKQVLGVL